MYPLPDFSPLPAQQPIDASLAGAFVSLTEPHAQQLDAIDGILAAMLADMGTAFTTGLQATTTLGTSITAMLSTLQGDLAADALIDPVTGVLAATSWLSSIAQLATSADAAASAGPPSVPWRLTSPPGLPPIPSYPSVTPPAPPPPAGGGGGGGVIVVFPSPYPINPCDPFANPFDASCQEIPGGGAYGFGPPTYDPFEP